MVEILIVYFYFEFVCRKGLEIYPNLLKGMQAGHRKWKRKRQVFGALLLLGTNHVLSNAEFGKFCVRVEGYRETGRITVE